MTENSFNKSNDYYLFYKSLKATARGLLKKYPCISKPQM